MVVTDTPNEGEDVKVESSTTEEQKGGNDNVSESNAKESKTIPYERFTQKVKENSYLKESVNSLKSEIAEIKSLLKSSKQVDYDGMTPQELAKHIREEVLQEQKLEQMQEAQKVQEAEQFIDEFFDNLENEGHKFDANEVMKLAVDEFDNDLPKAWKAYQREQKARQEIASEKAKQKAKEGESISGKKGEEVKSPRTTARNWNDVYEAGFKYIK